MQGAGPDPLQMKEIIVRAGIRRHLYPLRGKRMNLVPGRRPDS